MSRIILMVSLLVLFLLLVLPSSPALHINCIREERRHTVEEEYTTLPKKTVDDLTHPFLYLLVSMTSFFRYKRFFLLYEYACEESWPYLTIYHPIIFARCVMLVFTTLLWINFWGYVSDILGWNWQ